MVTLFHLGFAVVTCVTVIAGLFVIPLVPALFVTPDVLMQWILSLPFIAVLLNIAPRKFFDWIVARPLDRSPPSKKMAFVTSALVVGGAIGTTLLCIRYGLTTFEEAGVVLLILMSIGFLGLAVTFWNTPAKTQGPDNSRR